MSARRKQKSRNSTTRRNIAARSAMCLLLLMALSCAKESDRSPTSAPPVTQAPGYGDGTTAAPALAASPAAPGTAAAVPGAALSTPGPLALGCTMDAHCMTHRCNVAFGKCAWPCQTDTDCMPGNGCVAPTCLPKLK